MSTNGVIIENEAAWEAGKKARIVNNARTTWIRQDPTREALEQEIAALAERKPDGFFGKMWESLGQWGRLTDNQEAACRRIIAENNAKRDQRIAERKAADSTSRHVGRVGDRMDLVLTVQFITSFETQFGLMVITKMTDEAGNIFINKGRALGIGKGNTAAMRATIKEHGMRDGVAQTVINRAKVAA